MRVTCIQTNPKQNLEDNIEFISQKIRIAKENFTDVVLLPEMFSFMGTDFERLKTQSKISEGIFIKIQNLAKELNLYIVSGSHAETNENNLEKVFNTSVTYDNNGNMISTYRKIHLFNLKDEKGNKLYCESDVFSQGLSSHIYNINCHGEIWKAFTMICYDIRFPELIRKQNEDIDIIFIPAAFTWQTGQDHWEVLLRARAIENQCYVVACNQTGFYSNNQKRNYGHSMIIDPWGKVMSSLGEEIGCLSEVLTKDKIIESRARLPALTDRKIF